MYIYEFDMSAHFGPYMQNYCHVFPFLYICVLSDKFVPYNFFVLLDLMQGPPKMNKRHDIFNILD